MSFQDIVKVEKPDFYLDVAFRRAKAAAAREKTRETKRDRLKLQKDAEMTRIETILKTVEQHFNKILTTFPDLRNLTPFYSELVRISVDVPYLRKSFGAVKWVTTKQNFLARDYRQKIRKAMSYKQLAATRNSFYGRFSSLVKQIKKELAYLEEVRKVFRKFPVIKSMKTAVIIGFPNVGKTTLLYKLTGSKPEINSYPFTTKNINIGYIDKKVQLVDVPGTLNRFEKMNRIEQQAAIALKHIADLVVYVFDLTEPYPLEKQKKLLKKVQKQRKDSILFLSKTDILDKKQIADVRKEYKIITDREKLKKLICSQ